MTKADKLERVRLCSFISHVSVLAAAPMLAWRALGVLQADEPTPRKEFDVTMMLITVVIVSNNVSPTTRLSISFRSADPSHNSFTDVCVLSEL